MQTSTLKRQKHHFRLRMILNERYLCADMTWLVEGGEVKARGLSLYVVVIPSEFIRHSPTRASTVTARFSLYKTFTWLTFQYPFISKTSFYFFKGLLSKARSCFRSLNLRGKKRRGEGGGYGKGWGVHKDFWLYMCLQKGSVCIWMSPALYTFPNKE